jgi:TonB family protein
MKTRDVRPQYPQSRAGTDAAVFLEAIIDTNGFVKGLLALQPADADFAEAAITAINQWQFAPTRLHGVAVDTAMRITVRFQH